MKRFGVILIKFMLYFDVMFLFEMAIFDHVNYGNCLGLAAVLAVFTEIGNPKYKKKDKSDHKK